MSKIMMMVLQEWLREQTDTYIEEEEDTCIKEEDDDQSLKPALR